MEKLSVAKTITERISLGSTWHRTIDNRPEANAEPPKPCRCHTGGQAWIVSLEVSPEWVSFLGDASGQANTRVDQTDQDKHACHERQIRGHHRHQRIAQGMAENVTAKR